MQAREVLALPGMGVDASVVSSGAESCMVEEAGLTLREALC